MIEQKIQELIDALNANTAALTGTASKSKKAAAKPETETTAEKIVTPPATKVDAAPVTVQEVPITAPAAETSEVTMSAMREVCQQILDKGGKEKLREVNAKHNLARATESIGTVKANAVFADLKALAASL